SLRFPGTLERSGATRDRPAGRTRARVGAGDARLQRTPHRRRTQGSPMTDPPHPDLSSQRITRREFLERGACLGAGVGLVASVPAIRLASRADTLSLENEFIAGVWTTDGGVLRARESLARRSRAKLSVPVHVVALTLAERPRVDST